MNVDKQVRDFGRIWDMDDHELEVEVDEDTEVDDLTYYVG